MSGDPPNPFSPEQLPHLVLASLALLSAIGGGGIAWQRLNEANEAIRAQSAQIEQLRAETGRIETQISAIQAELGLIIQGRLSPAPDSRKQATGGMTP